VFQIPKLSFAGNFFTLQLVHSLVMQRGLNPLAAGWYVFYFCSETPFHLCQKRRRGLNVVILLNKELWRGP